MGLCRVCALGGGKCRHAPQPGSRSHHKSASGGGGAGRSWPGETDWVLGRRGVGKGEACVGRGRRKVLGKERRREGTVEGEKGMEE